MLIKPGTAGYEILPRLLEIAAESGEASGFLKEAAMVVAGNHRELDRVAIVEGVKGSWRELAGIGATGRLPQDLLGEVLDREECVVARPWAAVPLPRAAESSLVLVVRSDHLPEPGELASLAGAMATCLPLVVRTSQLRGRADRLAAILDMTVQWNQTRQTDELLQSMAETSTRLLDAERATIFLLDASGTRLMGRPALGVEGGELSISAATGVVGQVVQTGQPRRVDADIANEQAEIDREVDRQLGFETESLLCVPMFGGQGQTIGAFELINKRGGNFSPADEQALTELAAHAAVAIENTRHMEGLSTSRRNMAEQAAGKVQMIGDSPVVDTLRSTIARVAETELAVLILGENGTGKEVAAQMIHYLSPRRDQVLVAVNCAAITESLLESELFGHERGAFTDAHESRQGKFELANGGTLFLDEIGDMSPGGQAKLLRVLEEKVVVRVGGSRPIAVDTRVIAATNQDLGKLVREKKFREDLFFRLNVVTLQLPPLRDRGDDILTLAEHFLAEFCGKARRPVPRLTTAARKKLVGHSWPGNIRELRNMMERLAYLLTGERIDVSDLPFVMPPGNDEQSISLEQTLADATRQFQADFIERQIHRAQGNMTEAAQRLGLHRSNLYRKMKQLGMEADEPAP